MSQPTAYTPAVDFSAEEASAVGGRSTVRTAALDAELAAIELTLDGVLTNLSLNQRDDGEIRDGRVKVHTLGADVRALLAVGNVTASNLKGAWVTATAYVQLDVVTQGGNTYICAVAHTAGTFATDLAAVKWLLLTFGTAVNASAVTFTPTATIAATNVQAAIDEADTENRALSAAAAAGVTALSTALADSSSTSNGDALYAVKLDQTGAVARTGHGKNADFVTAADFDVDPTGVLESTNGLNAAIAATTKVVYIGPGTYSVSALSAVTGRTIRGAGAGLTTLKIKAGSTANILNANTVDDFTLEGVTLDYTGGGAGTGECAVFTTCARLRLRDVRATAAKGVGIRLTNCPDFRVNGVWIDTATDWGMLVDGASCTDGYASDLKFTGCTNRGLMVRTAVRCVFDGVAGKNNGATAAWLLDCTDCKVYGVTDYGDTVGDSAVIEGASVGCLIDGVSATTCGGHTASISASATASPTECHIVNVYSTGAGECMAAITDQGTGHQPTNCSIRNVSGRNCGRVTPSEGFAISNAVGCTIEGLISDTAGTMTYAVKEGGASPSKNRFIVSGWVSGTSGYASIGSSTSGVDFPRLERTRKIMADSDLTIDAGADGRNVFANTALTAARDLNLPKTWAGDEFWVYRFAGGAFNLNVKDAGATFATLTTAGTAVRCWFDGANWNKAST